jgi:anthranilate phosphoribosyltransferase
VLQRLGSEACWVVHGDGLDELTTTGTSQSRSLARRQGSECFTLTRRCRPEARDAEPTCWAATPAENAEAIMHVLLGGATGRYRDIVLLNAAAALIVAGRSPT